MKTLSRKKKEPITGVSREPENKLTVQKSTPLSVLWQSDLTLSEFKILDTYLSRIDSRNPKKRAVRFEKGELEKLLGVKKINTPELQTRVAHLMKPLILKEGVRGFRGLSLFEEAVCHADERGVWQVDLECTQKAMKYFFNVESIGYYRYKLHCIAGLKSRYSYVLFNYLERNRFRKSWEESIDELRRILSCENEPTYQQFYRFNDLVLKNCQKEIFEKTDCRFVYEPVKAGRTITAIRFTVETLPKPEMDDPNQITFLDEPKNDVIGFLQGVCCPAGTEVPEFDRTQMQELFEILVTVPDDKLPKNVHTGDIELRRYHFLAYLYAAMNRQDKPSKPIKHRFAYFVKMLKSEAGIS